jgi:hypothetical protein
MTISVRFPQYKILLRLKNNLIDMSTEKHLKLIYRILVKSLFTVDQLCEFDSDEMKQNQPILSACKGSSYERKKQFF